MAEQSSRRSFIRRASFGTAVLGASVLAPAALSQAADALPDGPASGAPIAQHEGPLMAYVKNARSGEVAVMVGEREVVHHDPQLAARLARIAATSAS